MMVKVKPRMIQLLLFMVVGICGCLFGMAWQHLRSGLHITPIDQIEWESQHGLIRLEHAYETVGAHFLQPAVSRITLQPVDGQKLVLFQGQPIFQEKYPIVKTVRVLGKDLVWNDGLREYSLRIELLKAD